MKISFYGIPHVLLAFLAVIVFKGSHPGVEAYINHVSLNNLKNPQKLAPFLERVYQKTLDSGITNFTPYALMLIKESQKALGEKDLKKAELFSEYAGKLAPDLPPVSNTKALVQWSKNKILVHRLIQGYVKAFIKELQHLESLSFMLFASLLTVAVAFLLTICVFTAISMIKYFTLAFHDLRHIVTKAVPDKALWGMLLIVFFLPVFLGFSVLPVCIYWLILLFSYHSKKERLIITGAFLLFSLMPLVISGSCFSLYISRSDVIQLLWKANHGYWDQTVMEKLEKYSEEHPEDQDVLFSAGLLHKKEMNYRTSRKYYDKLIGINPGFYKAYINLGNVCLATENWDEAVEKYKTAISIKPSLSAAAHFNLTRAYQQKFMFREAEEELAKAKKIDSSRIDSYLKIYSENYNRLLMDETISKKRLWNKGYLLFRENNDMVNGCWDLLFRGIPFKYATAVVLCLLLLMLILSRNDKLRVAIKCKTCGRSICKRCQRNISGDVKCYQCINISSHQEGSDYRLMENQKIKVKKYLKRFNNIGAALTLLLPGAGHLWNGHTARGIIYLLLFCFFAVKLIAVVLLEGPWEFVVTGKMTEIIILLFLLLFFWLMSVIDTFKNRKVLGAN